jgi:hypothetical protein
MAEERDQGGWCREDWGGEERLQVGAKGKSDVREAQADQMVKERLGC